MFLSLKRSLLCALPLMLGAEVTLAEVPTRTFCSWDPVGANGPLVTMVNEMKPKALAWGANLDVKAYTDEKIASNDFKAGACDAVLVTEVMAREYNRFTGTLGAVGAIPGEDELRSLLTTLSDPKAKPLMREGKYEIGGIVPIGAVFIFVRDRNVDSVEKFQGKKMAVFDNDPVAKTMVRRVGGSVVGASLSSFAGYFNNGSVDIIFAPAVAFDTMELYRGIEGGGGILSFPLLQTSMQIVVNAERFDENFGQNMRSWIHSQLDTILERVHTAEKTIPSKYWVSIPETRHDEYSQFMRESRISLMNDGLYDQKALQVMKRVRCRHAPQAGECSTNDE
ncbi:MAG: hypothetical protein IPM37_18980 [Hahellaceae bacterium]|nr:hypothetical protein [Hahellaceae bacterium]